ncbi:MAG: lytic transglycosylase domain-containing protein [Alphaproteobacteria bacterium]|nr:lytic transglycosylase domain-containing protein [Alphaproteobacteria bacterium]
MSATKIIAACLMMASQTYNVPPALMVGIYKAEGGKIGQEVANENGSHDLGPMQINTVWLPELAKRWKVSEDKAHKMVRDDACINTKVAAWILRNHINETQSLSQALQHYHSRTPRYGMKYKQRVLDIMYENGLIKTGR